MVWDMNNILIDGISGSGKTTLANLLGQRGYQVLHLDDWYPGWDGLAAGSQITAELLAGTRTSYPQWDWDNNCVGTEVPVDLSQPWIIEGCGALTPATAPFASLRIWMELPVAEAKGRALARDGDTYAPWWQHWHDQELRHWDLNHPRSLADLRLSGARLFQAN